MQSRRRRFGVGALLLLAAAGCGSPRPAALRAGVWHAWLESPGGPLPFGLELTRDDDGWHAQVHNGEERAPVPRVEWQPGHELVLAFDHFDSAIRATLDPGGDRLDGTWLRTSGPGTQTRMAFNADYGDAPRFPPIAGATPADPSAARWSMRLSDTEDPAILTLDEGGDHLAGTVLTTMGDYRFLAGTFEGGRLRLSTFDGAHAFLFDARLQADGTLAGDFWSRDLWHETWTAVPAPGAELPDPFAEVAWLEGADLSSATYPDLDGQPRSLAGPDLGGTARLLVLFGSWCPNCNDATDFLVELDRRYRDRGLTIVGLAFEMTGDFERDSAQVARYAAYHGIEYPLLVAGLSDKAEASRAFPWIERVKAFPTFVFQDAAGAVRGVYSGFSGPATGPAHDVLRDSFVELLERLLSGEDGPPAGNRTAGGD